MRFMNEYDIEQAKNRYCNNPILSQAARVLSEYRDIVNSYSDGWGTWTAGTKPAESLIDILERGQATKSDVQKAITRIKSFCTRRNLPKPASI